MQSSFMNLLINQARQEGKWLKQNLKHQIDRCFLTFLQTPGQWQQAIKNIFIIVNNLEKIQNSTIKQEIIIRGNRLFKNAFQLMIKSKQIFSDMHQITQFLSIRKTILLENLQNMQRYQTYMQYAHMIGCHLGRIATICFVSNKGEHKSQITFKEDFNFKDSQNTPQKFIKGSDSRKIQPSISARKPQQNIFANLASIQSVNRSSPQVYSFIKDMRPFLDSRRNL